ncbi:MAG: hypothetical protein KAJ18_04535 [Candidatus Omnitrophica bacterium]|nr:hypothetical protein [Candidatus Omnitrophota bacterium]
MENFLAEQIEKIVLSILKEDNLELVALKIKQHNAKVILEVFVDEPRGGVTLDICAGINRRLNEKIEEDELIDGEHVVSVCSPGLDWPLKTKKDFLRVQGRKIRVLLIEKLEGKGEYTGTVDQVHDDEVVLQVKDKVLTVPLDKIQKADQLV